MCDQKNPVNAAVMKLIEMNKHRTHWEPTVSWWLNVRAFWCCCWVLCMCVRASAATGLA